MTKKSKLRLQIEEMCEAEGWELVPPGYVSDTGYPTWGGRWLLAPLKDNCAPFWCRNLDIAEKVMSALYVTSDANKLSGVLEIIKKQFGIVNNNPLFFFMDYKDS